MSERGDEQRARLRAARLMLIFGPELCGDRDPLAVLSEVAPLVDVIQVRAKSLEGQVEDPTPRPVGSPSTPAPARASYEWTRRVLELLEGIPNAPLVLVDDRVDVAAALAPMGCAGVHLGRHDFPTEAARRLLGPEALIGLSTHGVTQVVQAEESAADYLGFGPIFATRTKGYDQGLGADLAWVAKAGSPLPLFPIGGIDTRNIHALVEVGRAAVGSGILSQAEPQLAAKHLRTSLDEASG